MIHLMPRAWTLVGIGITDNLILGYLSNINTIFVVNNMFITNNIIVYR